MFNPFTKEDPDLTAAIASAYTDLEHLGAHDESYSSAVDQIVKLNSLKTKGIDPNTLITVAGNLLIGFAVLKYERTGVITTKLWSFVTKPGTR